MLTPDAWAFTYGGKYDSGEERIAVQQAEQALDFREYDKAWTLALEARRRYPESLTALRGLIDIAYQSGRLSEALDLLKAPDGTEADTVEGHYTQAWAGILIGDPTFARPHIERAMELATRDDFELRRVMLVVKRNEGKAKREDLLADYEKLLAGFPDVGLAHLSYVNFVRVYGRGEKRYREAVTQALAAPARTPELYLIAASLEEVDNLWYDPQSGLAMMEMALGEFPESPDLALRKCEYLRRLGRAEEALALCLDWRKRAPNHGDFFWPAIDILADTGRWDEAIALCREILSLNRQTYIVKAAPMRLARLLHDAGRDDEAVAELGDYIRREPGADDAGRAVQLMTRLQGRKPGERVHLLTTVPFMQQRGNYCGPASINMMLRALGMNLSQDEIGARVYTGIAGTPPQVLHHYARSLGMGSVEFEADEQAWKRLLDAGYPILWLQMLGSRGAHYRVISGYDDVLKSWIVHDPNYYAASRFPFDEINDKWFLPSVRRSIVFYPQDRADDPALEGLRPTPILFVTNWAMYIATGANLFVGLFPALPVNLLVAAALAFLIAVLLRLVSFPRRPISHQRVVAVILLAVLPLNLLVGLLHWSGAVSVLLGLHLSLLSMVPLLLLVALFRKLTHDHLHPRESVGFVALVVVTWIALSFLDEKGPELTAIIGTFAIGLPVLMYPRVLIKRAERAARRGDLEGARRQLRRWGGAGACYFSAISAEMDALLSRGESGELARVARQALERHDWPREHDQALRLHLLLAESLTDAPGAALARIDVYLESPRLAEPIRILARGIRLHFLPGTSMTPPSDGEIDELLASIDKLGRRGFPGLPIRRSERGSAIQQAVMTLAVTGALRLAATRHDEERQRALWTRWGHRLGMIFLLEKGLGAALGAMPPRA